MRSRYLFPIAVLVAFVGWFAGAAAAETYGSGVTLPKATDLKELLQRPQAFEGQTVRVEGVVTAVCTEMGCWMALAPDATKDAGELLIQVEHDGKIVFPISAKGKRASAQGQLERIGGSAEGREAAAELAREKGQEKQEPSQWRVKATGAVVF